MKTVLRACFAGFIVLGLASQVVRGERGSGEADPASAVAGRLATLNIRTDGPAASDVMLGRSPLREEPVLVTLLRIDGADDGRLQGLLQSGRLVTYIYLGAVAEHPERAAVTARFVWATIRFIAGLRSYKPSDRIVVVALPRACPALMTMNWSALYPSD